MKISIREMKFIVEALGYGVMFSKSETDTIEFAQLKIKIEEEIENELNDFFCHDYQISQAAEDYEVKKCKIQCERCSK